jgi:uncharacterized protein YkwD
MGMGSSTCGRTLAAVIVALSAIAASSDHARAENLAAAAQAAISHYRQQHGLPGVTADPKLAQLAHEQAAAMARTGVLDHDVDRPFSVRIVRYNADVAAENIAAGTATFASTLALWKTSAGHNANLLRHGVTRIGIASAPAPQSKYKVFWALILAGKSSPPKLRRTGGPADALRAASIKEPVVRVRAQPPASGVDSGLFSGLSRLLRPLVGDDSARPK